MRSCLALVALLVIAPVAAAQSDAPPVSSDATVLYAHNADGSDELVGWANTLESDGDDVAMGPSGSCDPHSGESVDFTLVPPSQDIDRTYQLPLLPEQAGTLVLDAAPIQATLHIGSGSCYGEVDVTTRLVSGDTVIAEGSKTGHQYNDAGSDPYPTADIEMSPEVTEADLASLVWEVHVTGKTGGSLFMSVSSDRGMTRIDLPVLEVRTEPGVVVHNATEEDLTVSLDLANTTANHRYDWSMGPAAAVVFAQGEITAGEVAVRAVDAANATVYEATFSGAANDTQQFEAEAGDWSVHVNATSATGNLTVLFGPPETSSQGNGTEDPDGNGTEDPDGNGTGTGDGNMTDEDEESPALPWVVAVGLLAVAAARRRR